MASALGTGLLCKSTEPQNVRVCASSKCPRKMLDPPGKLSRIGVQGRSGIARLHRSSRADQIDDLSRSPRSGPRTKLTVSSPTKRRCWCVNGGDSSTAERWLIVLQRRLRRETGTARRRGVKSEVRYSVTPTI